MTFFIRNHGFPSKYSPNRPFFRHIRVFIGDLGKYDKMAHFGRLADFQAYQGFYSSFIIDHQNQKHFQKKPEILMVRYSSIFDFQLIQGSFPWMASKIEDFRPSSIRAFGPPKQPVFRRFLAFFKKPKMVILFAV